VATPNGYHRKLPDDRQAVTRRFLIPFTKEDGTVDRLKLYVTAGLYSDGSVGEIFIRADRVGSFMSGALDTVAMMFSIALQHGVPLKTLTNKLRGHKFGPSGFLGDQEFHSCTSPFDAVAQFLDARFGQKPAVKSDEAPANGGSGALISVVADEKP
jgi:ribonucleoside-diphosphate reductase alpha chain